MTKKAKYWDSNDYLLKSQIDGGTILEIKEGSIQDLGSFAIETVTGSVRVHGSLDGTNYTAPQLVLAQEPAISADALTETEGTLVAVTSTTKRAFVFGGYRSIRFQQVGATAARVRVRGTEGRYV